VIPGACPLLLKPRSEPILRRRNIQRSAKGLYRAGPVSFCLTLIAAAGSLSGNQLQSGPTTLKNLSLEALAQIEVVSPAKEPQGAFRVPMAIYVITGDEIRRSGATSIPDA
jgi:iron complex outermembrane receptor protein